MTILNLFGDVPPRFGQAASPLAWQRSLGRKLQLAEGLRRLTQWLFAMDGPEMGAIKDPFCSGLLAELTRPRNAQAQTAAEPVRKAPAPVWPKRVRRRFALPKPASGPPETEKQQKAEWSSGSASPQTAEPQVHVKTHARLEQARQCSPRMSHASLEHLAEGRGQTPGFSSTENSQASRQASQQANEQANHESGSQTDRQAGSPVRSQPNRQTNAQTGRQAVPQGAASAIRQTNQKTDRRAVSRHTAWARHGTRANTPFQKLLQTGPHPQNSHVHLPPRPLGRSEALSWLRTLATRIAAEPTRFSQSKDAECLTQTPASEPEGRHIAPIIHTLDGITAPLALLLACAESKAGTRTAPVKGADQRLKGPLGDPRTWDQAKVNRSDPMFRDAAETHLPSSGRVAPGQRESKEGKTGPESQISVRGRNAPGQGLAPGSEFPTAWQGQHHSVSSMEPESQPQWSDAAKQIQGFTQSPRREPEPGSPRTPIPAVSEAANRIAGEWPLQPGSGMPDLGLMGVFGKSDSIAAPKPAKAETSGRDLDQLAADIKRIIDEEARRHGIPV